MANNNKDYISPELCLWTPPALYCYRRNCVCAGCFIHEHIETECSMKKVIPKIYAVQGEPKVLDTASQRIRINEYFKENNKENKTN